MSDTTQTTVQQHTDQLRRLGVPEKVVQEVARAQLLGLFEMVPSPDLVARTLDAVSRRRNDD